MNDLTPNRGETGLTLPANTDLNPPSSRRGKSIAVIEAPSKRHAQVFKIGTLCEYLARQSGTVDGRHVPHGVHFKRVAKNDRGNTR